MTDTAYDSAKRALEINQEIRRFVAAETANFERRLTELERRVDVISGGEREPRFEPPHVGSGRGSVGADVRHH